MLANRIKKGYDEIFYLLYDILRFLFKSKRLYNKAITGNEIIVLGNGPSLTKTLHNYSDYISNNRVMCVNKFPETDQYTNIKPKIFVMYDPIWLTYKDNGRLCYFDAIIKKTDWPLLMFLPFISKKTKEIKELYERLNDNENITLLFYNAIPYQSRLKYLLSKNGKGIIASTNVLHVCLSLCIFLGFKRIIIAGADYSWHEKIVLNSENEIEQHYEHFYYDDDSISLFKDTKKKISDEFLNLYKAFDTHYDIAKYAKKNNVDIFNCSERSFIDAYEHKTINDFT